MGVEAGRLTQRVTLTTPGAALPDGQGGWLPASADTVRSVWARVQPLKAEQLLRLGMVLDQQAYRVTVRAEVGPVAATQRLSWQGRTLAVQSATAAEDKTLTTLICLDSGQ